MTDGRASRTRFTLCALAAGLMGALALIGCGDAPDSSAGGAAAPLSKAEFVVRADRICAEVAGRFDELPEPEGGDKPVGLGGFIRDWIAQLRALEPPPAVADDWHAALDLLDRSADKLEAAEAGDEEAQSEALWNLQPRAQERLEAMNMPFEVCFVE